ncbi:MAG: transposase [Bacteroidia bacterium]
MEKFQSKYRIPSSRLQNWNYGAANAYFITICTKNRQHLFGSINNFKMHLNEIGRLVELEWKRSIKLRPDMKLELGEFVVMPNHFHGIIIIGENEFNTIRNYKRDIHDGTQRIERIERIGRDALQCVSTNGDDTNGDDTNGDITNGDDTNRANMKNKLIKWKPNHFGPQSKNLASIIRGFKGSVTNAAWKIGKSDFAWQPRFYDHIIRDEQSFRKIQNYIRNNPVNWEKDRFY